IYRLVYDGLERGPKPRMLDVPATQLINYLDHPNGWWRDNGQKEIVLRNDQSVVPALKQIALGEKGPLKEKPTPLGRIHALWTLDGLGASDKEILINAMDDKDAQVRKTAVWISESFLKSGADQMLARLEKLKDDESYDVR